MCGETIVENGETLKSIPKCYKDKKMCNKAVDKYPHALEFEFVPEWFLTQNMYYKAVILILVQENLFLNALRFKKCVIK